MARRFESFESIVNKAEAKNVYEKNAKASLAWFRREVGRMTGVTQTKIIRSPDLKPAARALKGRMYMYGYDPKHKETLPYYDTFPLIIMVGPAKGGFYGLNLHYLNYKPRALFLDEHMATAPAKITDKSRIRARYKLLKGVRKFKEFKPCFKHYLTQHIASRISRVPMSDWEIAIFLPTEQFKKKGKVAVWAESAKIARRT